MPWDEFWCDFIERLLRRIESISDQNFNKKKLQLHVLFSTAMIVHAMFNLLSPQSHVLYLTQGICFFFWPTLMYIFVICRANINIRQFDKALHLSSGTLCVYILVCVCVCLCVQRRTKARLAKWIWVRTPSKYIWWLPLTGILRSHSYTHLCNIINVCVCAFNALPLI